MLASLALRAVRRCRRLASAPGAARLVLKQIFLLNNSIDLKLGFGPVFVNQSGKKLKLGPDMVWFS